MKKILFLLFIVMITFSIYKFTNKKSTLYLSIGNTNGDYYYQKEDIRISEIVMSIEQNEKIKDKPFQQVLIKSAKIKIDANALFRLSNYDRILTQMEDLEELFVLLRKYCKERIEIILLKEDSELASYTNKKISILCQKYDIIITR